MSRWWLSVLISTLLPQTTQEEAVKLATEALAHDLGLSPDLVELRRASPVDWPDSSLGCPKEDEAYLQVVVRGYRVTLQADGRIFAVHVGHGRAVVCGDVLRERGGAAAREILPAEAEPAIALPEAPKLRELVLSARKDLSERLTIEAETVELIEVSEVVWPDASLGCPKPGKVYPQVTREGYRVRLRAGKRLYRYHSAQKGVPFLCES